jgi:hypothetical protein
LGVPDQRPDARSRCSVSAASLPTDDAQCRDWRGFAFLAIGIGALQ